MLTLDLANTVSLVTGSSRGIGRATALRLAEAGSDVVVTYFNSPDDAHAVGAQIREMGRRVLVIKADMSEHEDVEAMLAIVAGELGRLDVVVSNAAGGGFRDLMDASLRQFDYSMRMNVRPLMLLAQLGAPLFEKRVLARARIISITSLGGTRALPHYGLIGAAKGAIESMTRHLAMELGPKGVNVNCVCAGTVDTGALRHLPDIEEVLAARRARSLVGEDLTPEHVADAVAFLSSPLATMVQGQTLVVDGGSAIQVA